jgi:hypothetical protein
VKIIEEPQLVVKRKLPWLIDVLLYPANLNGIIQIGIFLFLLVLYRLLVVLEDRLTRGEGMIVCIMFYALVIGYILYYIGYCVYDSAKGGLRAPVISIQHTPDKGDLISQLFLILGCVAICFWPAAVYYGFTQRIDSTFWLLSACGAFFFPMGLLAVVMFDSVNALNPVLIVGSIASTFLPYCGLVLLVCGLGNFVVIVLPRLAVWRFVSNGVTIYLSLVAAHILGRFYWCSKNKLDWGI